jgi:hypothetical protein
MLRGESKELTRELIAAGDGDRELSEEDRFASETLLEKREVRKW